MDQLSILQKQQLGFNFQAQFTNISSFPENTFLLPKKELNNGAAKQYEGIMPCTTMYTGPNENGGGSVVMAFKRKAWFCKSSINSVHIMNTVVQLMRAEKQFINEKQKQLNCAI